MLKNLTLLAIAGLVFNAGCVINTNTTDTDTASTNNQTTDGTSTTESGTDTTDTTDGTATQGTTDDTATTGPTTTSPTTTDVPTSTTVTTTDSTTDATTGSQFGNCGWDATNKYYACMNVGEDPDGISPIECPDPLPAEGDPCDDTTPVNNVGCCLPDGTNYYCSAEGMVVLEACGA